jgi:hypothetical protein
MILDDHHFGFAGKKVDGFPLPLGLDPSRADSRFFLGGRMVELPDYLKELPATIIIRGGVKSFHPETCLLQMGL